MAERSSGGWRCGSAVPGSHVAWLEKGQREMGYDQVIA